MTEVSKNTAAEVSSSVKEEVDVDVSVVRVDVQPTGVRLNIDTCDRSQQEYCNRSQQ